MNAMQFTVHMNKCWESPTSIRELPDGNVEVDNDISAFDQARDHGLSYLCKAWHDGVRGELWECEDKSLIWICFDGMGFTDDMTKVRYVIQNRL